MNYDEYALAPLPNQQQRNAGDNCTRNSLSHTVTVKSYVEERQLGGPKLAMFLISKTGEARLCSHC